MSTFGRCAVICCAIGLLLLLASPFAFRALFLHNAEVVRHKDRDCIGNEQALSVAMRCYAKDHQETYPDSLGALLKGGYLLSARVFICPWSGHKVPKDFPQEHFEDVDLSILTRVDEWGDYALVRGVAMSDPDNFVLFHEKPGTHKVNPGYMCGFNDGHGQWLTTDRFETQMRWQDAEMRRLRQEREKIVE